MKKIKVEKDSYFDSVFLMLISREVKQIPGVQDAVVAMGTEVNLSLLKEIGFSAPEIQGAAANDLIIALEAENEEAAERALHSARDLLSSKKRRADEQGEYRPVGLDGALKAFPQANLLIVSVPGIYAAKEVRKALENDLHVMLFSDNVSLEDEIRLKKLAAEKGLLMMGPDCGTAIINGKPLCFANAVRRGDIGIVAASGTGLQELSCCIDKAGCGISQAIGTGGRDLKDPRVGGLMTMMGIEGLKNDPRTKVMVVISKPPAEELAGEVISRLKASAKPCVVHFLGLEDREASGNLRFARNLEEAAGMAAALSRGEEYRARTFTISQAETARIVAKETAGMSVEQKYLRGLFTGGTLADEALILLDRKIGGVYSNNQTVHELVLEDPLRSRGHTIVDLGDDIFTVGRPHPMIDPSIRSERILQEMEDPEVALLLLDLVLGYGAHADPAGAVLESLGEARKRAKSRGGYLCIVASLTGTAGDFQNMAEQKRKLESIGCVVMPSNYQASLLALKIIENRKGGL